MSISSLNVSAKALAVSCVLALSVLGCSPKDQPTYTPVYHVGTMTNSSSVNSWELNTAPINTQPGAYHGAPATLRKVPSLRGYEPYDPLAVTVFAALSSDASLNTRYLSAGAKQGTVMLVGTVASKAQRDLALSDAGKVAGVRKVLNHIEISPQQ